MMKEEYRIEKAIEFGANLLGYPYVWGSQRYHWGNGVLNINFKSNYKLNIKVKTA